jgi:hypothetical protein
MPKLHDTTPPCDACGQPGGLYQICTTAAEKLHIRIARRTWMTLTAHNVHTLCANCSPPDNIKVTNSHKSLLKYCETWEKKRSKIGKGE